MEWIPRFENSQADFLNQIYDPSRLGSFVVNFLYVVLDTDTYHTKMSALIETGPYQPLNKDPTDRLTRKLSERLLSLKRNGSISEAVYNKIRPRHKQPPRIYGLPKIHKANIPLRPTVSSVNTFASDLSAFLANILSPLTGNLDCTVTNSAHSASIISSEKIQD